MQEETLQQFFLEEIDAQDLQELVQEELDRSEEEEPTYHYQFRDMDTVHMLEPYDLVRLCDAVLDEILVPEGLTLIANILTESEKFDWEEDVISEVCYFWLEHEENYDLAKPENLRQFRRWLKGEEPLPV
ncbi:MAG: hypothetical protein IGS03_19140 [Candidatus Sericytochromatia bacterium]|nr:hypothetical protein [Candidatus Sericytochromatia bacterium]